MARPRRSQQGTAPRGHSGSTPTSPLPHLDRRHRPLLPLTPTPPPPSRAAVRLSTSAQRGWRRRRLHGGGVSSSDGGGRGVGEYYRHAAGSAAAGSGLRRCWSRWRQRRQRRRRTVAAEAAGEAPAAAFIGPPPAPHLRLHPVARGRWRQEWRKARGPHRAAIHATDIEPRGGGWASLAAVHAAASRCPRRCRIAGRRRSGMCERRRRPRRRPRRSPTRSPPRASISTTRQPIHGPVG